MMKNFCCTFIVLSLFCWSPLFSQTRENEATVHDSLQVELFRSYKSRYLEEGGRGNWPRALDLALESGAHLSEALPAREEADWIYDLGYLYDMNGDYVAALDHYKKSLVRYEALHDPEVLDLRHDMALVYNNIGVVHAHTGFFTERLKAYHKARELWEQVPGLEERYLLTVYGNLMRLYAQYGDRQGAEDLLQIMNRHFNNWLERGGKPGREHYINKHRIQLLYTDMSGDKAGGQRQLDSLLQHFEQLHPAKQRQYSSHLLSALQSAAGPFSNFSLAEERRQRKAYLDKALAESVRLGDRYNQMIAYSRLGSYYLEAEENPQRALVALDQALQIGEETDIRVFNRMNLYLKKAAILQQQGRFPEAEELVLEAVSVLLGQAVGDASVLRIDDFRHRNDVYYIEALKQMGGIYQQEYERQGEETYGRLALHFFDLAARLFNAYYQKGVYNPSLDALSTSINEGLLSLHLRLGEPDAAGLLQLVERNRSQHLAKEFDAKYLRFLNVPDSLFVQRNLLHLKMGELQGKSTLTEQEESHYRQLSKGLQAVEARIREKDQQYFPFFSDSLTTNDIQSALAEKQVLVRYLLASDNLYAFVLSRKAVRLFDLGPQAALLQKVRDHHQALQSIDGRAAALARELYQALLAPLDLGHGDLHSLVIVPDNVLNYLPFETLVDSVHGQPLVARVPISYSYGLRLWYLQGRAAEVSAPQKPFVAFAPHYSSDDLQNRSENRPGDNKRLQNLAGAAREAAAISRTWKGTLYEGEQATRARFLASALDYKIYHFAMHALMDEERPHHSSLVFQDEEELHYHELYGLHFPAEMVVLSACNTGMGKLVNGEGLLSLSRALTYSGVRSAVYSLWEVPDKETAVLMETFYRHLKKGHSRAEALALAKRDFLAAHPMKSHPFFWAGFVVNGHAGPLVSQKDLVSDWLLGVGGLAVGLLLLFGWGRFFKVASKA